MSLAGPVHESTARVGLGLRRAALSVKGAHRHPMMGAEGYWSTLYKSKNVGGAVVVKKLSRIGNSLGLVIERPILDLLNVDESTPPEITTDGDVLTIRPIRDAHRSRVRASAKQAMVAHRETLTKLAK